MLMRLHTGGVRTPKESALKVGSGRKVPCCAGQSNLYQQHAGLMLCQQLHPHPKESLWMNEQTLHITSIWWLRWLFIIMNTAAFCNCHNSSKVPLPMPEFCDKLGITPGQRRAAFWPHKAWTVQEKPGQWRAGNRHTTHVTLTDITLIRVEYCCCHCCYSRQSYKLSDTSHVYYRLKHNVHINVLAYPHRTFNLVSFEHFCTTCWCSAKLYACYHLYHNKICLNQTSSVTSAWVGCCCC